MSYSIIDYIYQLERECNTLGRFIDNGYVQGFNLHVYSKRVDDIYDLLWRISQQIVFERDYLRSREMVRLMIGRRVGGYHPDPYVSGLWYVRHDLPEHVMEKARKQFNRGRGWHVEEYVTKLRWKGSIPF